MKTLNIRFTEKEYNELLKAKRLKISGTAKLSWHIFLMWVIRDFLKYERGKKFRKVDKRFRNSEEVRK